MSSIKLEWEQASYSERFDVFRSSDSMDVESMPAPIASTQQPYYYDNTVTPGESYYYRVASVRGLQTMYSDEVYILADNPIVGDPHWESVNMLIFGDAETFPSSVFVDRSNFNSTVYKSATPEIVSPIVQAPSTDSGSIYLSGIDGDVFGIQTSAATNFGVDDFTIEFEFLIPSTLDVAPFYARIIDLNSLLLTTGADTHNTWQLGGTNLSPEISIGIWNNVCLMRKSGVLYLFINGVVKFSKAYANSLISYMRFGGGGVGGRRLNAYFNNVRSTKLARYDIAGYTPERVKFLTY